MYDVLTPALQKRHFVKLTENLKDLEVTIERDVTLKQLIEAGIMEIQDYLKDLAEVAEKELKFDS